MLSLFPTQGHVKFLGEFKNLGVAISARVVTFFINNCTLGLAGDKITFFLTQFHSFLIKLNTLTQHYCKDFLYDIVMPAISCIFHTERVTATIKQGSQKLVKRYHTDRWSLT